jgi:hypothetical protein
MEIKMKKNVILVILLAASITSAKADKHKVTQSTNPLPPLPEFILSTDGQTDVEYKKSTTQSLYRAQKNTRQIAQTDTIDENGFLTKSFIEIRDQFFAVKSAEQLDALIDKVSNAEYYNKLDRDGQFLALQFVGLKPYKSIIYRMRTYLGKHTALRSGIVTNLRIAAVAQNVFNPTPEQKAIFDYLTTPIAGMDSDIDTDIDLETFLVKTVVPSASETYKKFTALVRASERPIHWDNKVYASFANFSDSADRYAQIGMSEQYLILAGFEQSIASLLVTSAYSLEGFSDMIKRMSNEFGIDSFNPLTKVNGLTAKKRFSILKQFPKLMTLKPGGEKYTFAAYGFLKASLVNTKLAWNSLDKNETRSQISFVLNPQLLAPYNRQINSGLANLDTLFSGEDLSSAVVNGDKININFNKLFSKPPNMTDLYPISFNQDKENLTKIVGGKSLSYRNYLSESATGWNYQAYKVYLPNIKSSNDKTADVSKELSILSQVWGANILGISMSNFVF